MSDVVRMATPSEVPTCAAILNNWIDKTPWFPRIHTPEAVERHYREDVFVNRTLWVSGHPIHGFMAIDQESFITALYTATPGQGIGKRLLDHAKTLLDRLSLWTFVANTPAQRFYQREGFTEQRRTQGDNEEGLPDILYTWERHNA